MCLQGNVVRYAAAKCIPPLVQRSAHMIHGQQKVKAGRKGDERGGVLGKRGRDERERSLTMHAK